MSVIHSFPAAQPEAPSPGQHLRTDCEPRGATGASRSREGPRRCPAAGLPSEAEGGRPVPPTASSAGRRPPPLPRARLGHRGPSQPPPRAAPPPPTQEALRENGLPQGEHGPATLPGSARWGLRPSRPEPSREYLAGRGAAAPPASRSPPGTRPPASGRHSATWRSAGGSARCAPGQPLPRARGRCGPGPWGSAAVRRRGGKPASQGRWRGAARGVRAGQEECLRAASVQPTRLGSRAVADRNGGSCRPPPPEGRVSLAFPRPGLVR